MKHSPASRLHATHIFTTLCLALGLNAATADTVKVAVAANFTAAMKEIAQGFEEDTGHQALLSFGSTGKLYAQIINGAPFDVFLAADRERPMRLEQDGRASKRFTYAVGRLVLWSRNPMRVDGKGGVLHGETFKRLAIANPKTAPYGQAAMEILQHLGLDGKLRPKLVRGDSIAQTYQFAASGGAELGFVALAQVALSAKGSYWTVPQDLYSPIEQDAVLLDGGRGNAAAAALLDYLRSPGTRALIERFGYGID